MVSAAKFKSVLNKSIGKKTVHANILKHVIGPKTLHYYVEFVHDFETRKEKDRSYSVQI